MGAWDDVNFAQEVILAMASPLTRCLNGIPFDKSSKTLETIWTDAFLCEWQGQFSVIPKVCLTVNTKMFHFVKTRQMYQRCKEFFGYGPPNTFWNMYFDRYRQDKSGVDIIKLYNYHVAAMENLWLDELQEFLKYPIALAQAAVLGGHVQMLKLLVSEYGVEPKRLNFINSWMSGEFAMNIAASHGDLKMIKYLHSVGNQACTKRAIDFAVDGGHFETIKWLHENRTEGWSSHALSKAIEINRLDIIDYLASHRREGISDIVLVAAVKKRNLGLIKLLHEKYNIKCTHFTFEWALNLDDLSIAKYCLEHCTKKYPTRLIDNAALDGRLDIIQLLHESSAIGWSTQTMDFAASNGHIDIVKYLHENRSEGCTVKAMDGAAIRGHFDIVKFLHENRTEGCTTNAMDNAAAGGHNDIVRFLHYNRPEGCTKRAYDAAARNGHFGIVQFLLENGREEDHTKAMIRAGF
ncbi:hypothetical protein THRCLA_09215 [Thraustotheca clavata]|uniref:Uncharacterized protein n=1 Tax=Thraustotheca clavata TaxID=74557 RepID=A0A1V9YY51_9STRA|nr:hypothetical protein THRCLA_09215 [Thraustotheca clavata]